MFCNVHLHHAWHLPSVQPSVKLPRLAARERLVANFGNVKKTNMESFSCLPPSSSLGYLAKSLGALSGVPWEKVMLL